uniref:Dynein axonemal light chain 1 n=1 Tax=Chromera velia CCMP2878 TaxID=1169474 RepID=A0A0G4GA02_9ALVE|mmetsp:Transcript_2437/g.5122  ORF Transcript_2437/g.5122 Transcript_2437/m.5122 type:complete len:190 (-) Transcript_2437:33-602(-)|eukprot:Cvel_20897.t1-p1 / transcript=Cvel_20897.t1 / gene=Cvel_20897 / organism=Chromera_velia_CCMP2878 / gene_product=Dynein light chain 1, axonemal, putative / transcript_product=Dynein light chain 1, axonemal, putative / location=Cvel_scaffold1916:20717-23652(+) / protein_length=189 / sequence_SO=supercontig / SO=protein_coding / is_pseudo=false
MTSCAKAIQMWEEKTEKVAAEADEVKLICQVPPITKMDAALNTLVNCKKLSLSTNSIDKIINLPNLKNLEILSLGRNVIKKIAGLDEIGATLRELWISYNLIDKLDGLSPCVKLQVLFMSNNKIKNWEEIEKLASLPELQNVLFIGNPIYDGFSKEDVKPKVVKRLPNIKTLDGQLVSDSVRELAGSAD